MPTQNRATSGARTGAAGRAQTTTGSTGGTSTGGGGSTIGPDGGAMGYGWVNKLTDQQHRQVGELCGDNQTLLAAFQLRMSELWVTSQDANANFPQAISYVQTIKNLSRVGYGAFERTPAAAGR